MLAVVCRRVPRSPDGHVPRRTRRRLVGAQGRSGVRAAGPRCGSPRRVAAAGHDALAMCNAGGVRDAVPRPLRSGDPGVDGAGRAIGSSRRAEPIGKKDTGDGRAASCSGQWLRVDSVDDETVGTRCKGEALRWAKRAIELPTTSYFAAARSDVLLGGVVSGLLLLGIVTGADHQRGAVPSTGWLERRHASPRPICGSPRSSGAGSAAAVTGSSCSVRVRSVARRAPATWRSAMSTELVCPYCTSSGSRCRRAIARW